MPHTADTPEAMTSNGKRLATLRMRRRWTQQRLATESGYSLASVRAFERGGRSLDRASVILAFARALGCHPAEITGQLATPFMADPEGQAAISSVAAVHRSLLMHGRTPRIADHEAAAVNLAELRARVVEANRHRQTAGLATSGALLPDLLRDLQVAVHVLTGDERREAYGLLGSGYECAMQYLYKLGRVEAATLATERVQLAVQGTEDPLRILSARWYEAGEYLSIGEHDEAGAIIDGALTDLGRIRDRGPEAVSLTGAFHLKAALNAARAADEAATNRHHEKATTAAEQLGEDRNDFQLQFGPTNAAIWSITLPVELGHGREAVRRAEHVTSQVPAAYAPERRSNHYIDVGRAHWYNGQASEALDAFLQAERIAPQQTRMHPGVKETVRTMRAVQNRSLSEFALRVGVA